MDPNIHFVGAPYVQQDLNSQQTLQAAENVLHNAVNLLGHEIFIEKQKIKQADARLSFRAKLTKSSAFTEAKATKAEAKRKIADLQKLGKQMGKLERDLKLQKKTSIGENNFVSGTLAHLSEVATTVKQLWRIQRATNEKTSVKLKKKTLTYEALDQEINQLNDILKIAVKNYAVETFNHLSTLPKIVKDAQNLPQSLIAEERSKVQAIYDRYVAPAGPATFKQSSTAQVELVVQALDDIGQLKKIGINHAKENEATNTVNQLAGAIDKKLEAIAKFKVASAFQPAALRKFNELKQELKAVQEGHIREMGELLKEKPAKDKTTLIQQYAKDISVLQKKFIKLNKQLNNVHKEHLIRSMIKKHLDPLSSLQHNKGLERETAQFLKNLHSDSFENLQLDCVKLGLTQFIPLEDLKLCLIQHNEILGHSDGTFFEDLRNLARKDQRLLLEDLFIKRLLL